MRLESIATIEQVAAPDDFHVIILGAGVSGICMGKKLQDLGIRWQIVFINNLNNEMLVQVHHT